MAAAPEILTFLFKDSGSIPNNPALPVVIYKRIAPADMGSATAMADWFEALWPQHGWQAAWRYGVYTFPHYHSTAHEILGVYRGQATIRLGAATGVTVLGEAGDVLVLPAGTGHENLGSSRDFHVVGGYPMGQTPDLLRGAPRERPAALERIARVPLPASDPLRGAAGPLMKAWQIAPA
jgi:uncharacterized protein YjlB